MEIQINSLGEAIRHKRCLLNLTQAKLAKAVKVDNTYISKLENNHTLPSWDLLDRLEVVLHFQKGDLAELCGFPSQELIDILGEAIKLKEELAVKEKIRKFLND
ncbi:helix-turn-helix transcriptional regulator [Microcoleus sp. T3B2]|uniref:helix-turn-helix transcriptional regulator n=1 Tax=Microcoleus sp. T3B2 TaxID=3055426 RepID=UPI002FCE9FCB